MVSVDYYIAPEWPLSPGGRTLQDLEFGDYLRFWRCLW